jgi:hypothetical protein
MNKKDIKKNSDLVKGDKNLYDKATEGSFVLAMLAEMESFSM